MTTPKMHTDEVDIDPELVRTLVTAQFPRLSNLSISAVASTGTVNAIYRLGHDFYARLPRVEAWARDLAKELSWLPLLAPHLSLPVPEPVATGEPACGYPFHWAIYRWIDGEPYADVLIDDQRQAAVDLAQFVAELHGIEPMVGAQRGGRDPLREVDTITRTALEASHPEIDTAAAMAAWDLALTAPAWAGTPVWIHSDLLPPNLLVRAGRICAVIDFGAVGLGDPAMDVIAAWSVFGATGRSVFRAALDVDDGTWNRARGYALHQASMIIPYYRVSNPGFVSMAQRTIEQVISDVDGT
jgi:aminoglycoside phosphotransferase (APT) family kinase protein